MPTKIDILMAVYNNEKYLLDQLESIMSQNYSDFRLVIRDDASTDNSLALLEKFAEKHPEKVLLIKGCENLGARGNFAALLHYATAPYILFSDGDDFWLPEKIEKTLKVMLQLEKQYGDTTPLLVHTDLRVVNKKLFTLSSSFWQYTCLQPGLANHLNRLLVQNVITGCTMMINQPLLKLAQPIPNEAIMHDWWIGLVASIFGKIDYIKDPTILYRQHDNNIIGAKSHNTLQIVSAALKPGAAQHRKRSLMRTIAQAEHLLHRYQLALNPTTKQLLEDYASLKSGSAVRKRYLMCKHYFFKNNPLRTLGMFVSI